MLIDIQPEVTVLFYSEESLLAFGWYIVTIPAAANTSLYPERFWLLEFIRHGILHVPMNSKHHTTRKQITPYITKDGSKISELMHPLLHSSQNQSLAEAVVPGGTRTHLHRHHRSEELYHITSGSGMMQLGEDEFEVNSGDTVCIPPGTAHCIHNTGNDELVILCCCSPAYQHEDTELL